MGLKQARIWNHRCTQIDGRAMIEIGWFDVASVRLEGLLLHVNILICVHLCASVVPNSSLDPPNCRLVTSCRSQVRLPWHRASPRPTNHRRKTRHQRGHGRLPANAFPSRPDRLHGHAGRKVLAARCHCQHRRLRHLRRPEWPDPPGTRATIEQMRKLLSLQ